MAGHSHWSKIKRAKGATDAKRGKVWSKIARKIIIAAKAGGGNPGENLALRYVIEEAKDANMHKDTIEKAILKGTGELGAENYEEATYEGYGPGGVAIMIEALTNNRTRTVADVRRIFEHNGGNFGATGSVAFQFTRRGVISIKLDAVTEEKLMDLALGAGADDITTGNEVYEVFTPPTAFIKVKEALAAANIGVEASAITYMPNNTVQVSQETAEKLQVIVDELEDNDDVQNVSHNADLSGAEVSAVEASK